MNNTLREQVKVWLNERGYAVGKSASGKGVAWMLDANQEKSGFRFSVGVLDKLPDSMIFMAEAPLSDYQLQLQSLTAKQRRALLFKTRFRLLSIADVKFDLPDDMSKIAITQELFTDEVTRGSFWRTVGQMGKALSCAAWTLEEEFEPESASASIGAGH